MEARDLQEEVEEAGIEIGGTGETEDPGRKVGTGKNPAPAVLEGRAGHQVTAPWTEGGPDQDQEAKPSRGKLNFSSFYCGGIAFKSTLYLLATFDINDIY